MSGVMEAVMCSSSYLKLISCRDNRIGFLCLKDDLFSKSFLQLPFYHSRNTHKNKVVDFNLTISVSSSRRGVRPVSLLSSHTQAEVDNHEFLIEESSNGYTLEAETEAEAGTQTVRVKFQLQRECTFGQNFLIAGDDPVLGLWDPNNAIPLTWSDGHLWSVDLDIPIGRSIKFKFIMQESDGRFVWQPGPDRILECFQTEKILTLCEDWESPDSRTITETDPTLNQEIGMLVEPSVRINGIGEPKGNAINLKEVLVSDEEVPVLVPGLSQLPPNDEPDPVNGASMVSTGADISESDSKGNANALNSNSRPEISSIHENQDSCENEHQEMKQVAQEHEHQASQPMKSCLLNNIQWVNNVMKKLLNVFRIQ